jgi:hypothetical protein
MTILQPEGDRAVCIGKLAGMIARSAAFAERCRKTDPDEILREHVHYPSLVDPDQIVRPFAIITLMPGGGYERYRVSGGSKTLTLPRGQFMVAFGDEYIEQTSGKDPLIDFLNFVDAVIDDVQKQSGVDDNLNITGWVETAEAACSDTAHTAEGAQKPFYDNWFAVSWDAL